MRAPLPRLKRYVRDFAFARDYALDYITNFNQARREYKSLFHFFRGFFRFMFSRVFLASSLAVVVGVYLYRTYWPIQSPQQFVGNIRIYEEDGRTKVDLPKAYIVATVENLNSRLIPHRSQIELQFVIWTEIPDSGHVHFSFLSGEYPIRVVSIFSNIGKVRVADVKVARALFREKPFDEAAFKKIRFTDEQRYFLMAIFYKKKLAIEVRPVDSRLSKGAGVLLVKTEIVSLRFID